MSILKYGFGAIVGIGLALLFLKSQSWSVKFIHPDHVKLSKWIVVGGAFIRWALVFLVFFFALSDSFITLMIVFCSFMISRLLILLKMQGSKKIKSAQIKSLE